MSKLYLLLTLFIPTILLGQRTITIGTQESLYSNVLQEDREYWVYLPPEYNNPDYASTKYPVIYLLDGDKNFSLVVGVQQALTRGLYNNMPQAIIVGIPNTDRTRDLTPTKSSLQRNGKEMYGNSGGAESFTNFIKDELKQTIALNYRTSGYDILIGHSFGGLFAINTLLFHTDLFNAYIALDPSLWWDSQVIYKEALLLNRTKKFKGISLYLAMARDKKDERKHASTMQLFCKEVIPHFKKQGLYAKWHYYPSEDHGTILTPAIFDAFKWLFKGYALPVKEVPSKPELIKTGFDAISKRLGHTFYPDEQIFVRLVQQALNAEQRDNAQVILDYYIECYPNSTKATQLFEKLR